MAALARRRKGAESASPRKRAKLAVPSNSPTRIRLFSCAPASRPVAQSDACSSVCETRLCVSRTCSLATPAVQILLFSPTFPDHSIIFCQHTAYRISARMTAEGHRIASLHGAKDPAERDAIIDNFRDGREKVLITTNVIARGIDILQVNMVVNYDLPLMYERNAGGGGQGGNLDKPDIETYIHRIGRTGRFGCRGISINYVHDKNTWLQMEQIEKETRQKILRIETNDVDEMEEKMKEALK
ncbi:P-loop containing nucleoside triphosphate hydrolase protein [Mycena galericulata]|nr:P-loop containing nucleoside triphosphate hydrolase protein [Mycena galericulata]